MGKIGVYIVVLALVYIVTLTMVYEYKKTKMLKLKNLVYTDELTGRWNLNRFIAEFNGCLHKNKKSKYALVYSDIDRLELINEAFGYKTGDAIICRYSDVLKEEINKDELFARVSGDNFISMVKYEDENDIISRIERISEKFITSEIPHIKQCRLLPISGIYLIKNGDSDINQMITNANAARKIIKGRQDMSICFHNYEIEKKISEAIEIERRMNKAVLNEDFKVYYQPKFNVENNKIIGAEALVRWNDSERGIISPSEFIPVFEANGFITEMDFYVYKKVLMDMRERIDAGKSVIPISLNLSRLHGKNNYLAKELTELAHDYGISPELIEFEITESAFSSRTNIMIDQLKIISEEGFKISIDDFGTGFSSLNTIKHFPADTIKIDKSFIDDIDSCKRAKGIVKAIVDIADVLEMDVICEGVENRKQAEFLKEVGCLKAQGYLFMKPIPKHEFNNALDSMCDLQI